MSGVKMGGVQMVQVDGQFHVWTKRVGSGPIQMLTLHGGPGCTHEYFECFEDFLSREGIQFIYYDQLGSAYSDQPENSSLWTIEVWKTRCRTYFPCLALSRATTRWCQRDRRPAGAQQILVTRSGGGRSVCEIDWINGIFRGLRSHEALNRPFPAPRETPWTKTVLKLAKGGRLV
jgi:pimeloyl-ACP methyl ester carboxylesterase